MSASTPSDGGRHSPMAGGQAISEAVAGQASEWLTVMMSGEVSDEERGRWLRWRAEHPDHERAWRHVESVIGKMKRLSPRAAYNALSPYAEGPSRSAGRRKALRALLWTGGVLGGSGLLASHARTWQQIVADFRTGTGERQSVTLDDGSAITLNTATAIDVRFDSRQRLVRLVTGEVLVVTAHAASASASTDSRPFVVETADGRVRALGTRFTVRRHGDDTRVVVLESAVEVTPRDGGQARVLRAGERASFSREAIGEPEAAGAHEDAWTRGQLLASDMRLGDFIAELGRYRPGIVRCVPELAELRISGVFPLQDTDRILSSLPRVLPVQVNSRTRYWVTVEAAR
ncbi:MAG: FecR domain-containing protein [Burkholderiaceae bacterium]